MTSQTNIPSLAGLGYASDTVSTAPLEKIDLSLYLPFGQWEKFEHSSMEDQLSYSEAIANLIEGHLFAKNLIRQMGQNECLLTIRDGQR